ncbi:MAG TPA: hypothetical protein DIU15_17305, partial [Deltaproteobacteria bacterium]|nr:hypothetical protein [Deltaproteobacteria bacterium]
NLGKIADQVARRKSTEEAEDVKERCRAAQPIVEKLLRRVPESRYQSAEDVLVQLAPVREAYPPNEGLKAFMAGHGPLVDEIIEQAQQAQLHDTRYGAAAESSEHGKYGPHGPEGLDSVGGVEVGGPARLRDPDRGDGWEFWDDGSGATAAEDAALLGDAESTWIGVDAEDDILGDGAPGGIPVAPTANKAPSLNSARAENAGPDAEEPSGPSASQVSDAAEAPGKGDGGEPSAVEVDSGESSVSDVVTQEGIKAVDQQQGGGAAVSNDEGSPVAEAPPGPAQSPSAASPAVASGSVDVEHIRRVAAAAELAGPENTVRSVLSEPSEPSEPQALGVSAAPGTEGSAVPSRSVTPNLPESSRPRRRRRAMHRARVRRLRTLVSALVALGGTILLLVGLVLTLAP